MSSPDPFRAVPKRPRVPVQPDGVVVVGETPYRTRAGHIVMTHLGSDPISSRDVALPVTGSNANPGVAQYGATVRRLTPVECERLMGWPDGHTAERIDLRTGRVVAQADSSRYRQCGNGMAAPVVEWIARRILAVEAATEETA